MRPKLCGAREQDLPAPTWRRESCEGLAGEDTEAQRGEGNGWPHLGLPPLPGLSHFLTPTASFWIRSQMASLTPSGQGWWHEQGAGLGVRGLCSVPRPSRSPAFGIPTSPPVPGATSLLRVSVSSLRNQLPLCSFPRGLNGLAATRVPASTGGTCTSVLHDRGGRGRRGAVGQSSWMWEEFQPVLHLGPSPSHLRWLSQGPLGPGHSLGKGHRTC